MNTPLRLYWSSGSCPSWTILLTLETKKLPYESKILQLSKKENQTPEYLAMNPRGKSPTFSDGDFVVYESIAILAYLERKYPDPAVLGTTASETATIMRLISEFRSYVEPEFDKIILPFWKNAAKENVQTITDAAAKIRNELATYEALLNEHEALVGSQLTAADFVLYPGLMQVLRVLEKPEANEFQLAITPLAEHYPNIARWKKVIEALPFYDKTYPPHWRA